MNIPPLRWITRILALVLTVWFLFWYTVFGIGSVVTDLHGRITPIIIPEIAFGIVLLTAYIISWWKENIGGILYVVASLGVTIPGFIDLFRPGYDMTYSQRFDLLIRGWTHLGFSLLLVGVLFLIVWRMSKKKGRDAPRPLENPS
jgi:hypothetical protein